MYTLLSRRVGPLSNPALPDVEHRRKHIPGSGRPFHHPREAVIKARCVDILDRRLGEGDRKLRVGRQRVKRQQETGKARIRIAPRYPTGYVNVSTVAIRLM